MPRRCTTVAALAFSCLFAGVPFAWADGTKVLIVGHKRDHPYRTHEYLAVGRLLADCLRQSPGVEATVVDGWPRDPQACDGYAAVVLYTSAGGNLLLSGARRATAERLFASPAGFVALHWATAAEGAEVGPDYQAALGGRFSFEFSGLRVDQARLRFDLPDHPILRGIEPFELRDEYYLNLRFADGAQGLVTALLPQTAEQPALEQRIAWTHERGSGGRSFGLTAGHFFDNFAREDFRRLVVQGILWSAKLDVPAAGAPVAIDAAALALPPDTAEHRQP
ncbi:MAG: ThuA domain-containing protein [Pirellulales bacterium]|nr:ThuA domain-containing protein [Pirellulales bacterium]